MLDEPIAFAASTDLARSREFYEGALWLTVLAVTPFALVLPGIRVTKVDSFTPQPFTVLGWRVDDIDSTIRTLTERGVKFTRYDGMGQDDLGVWTTPDGSKVAWFTDPDGNTLSLTQFAA
ncbi:putative enzyme related to lactoylglutathione lyase [Actinocrispum wychmicini]|uniref:Putative enzyme related to lactoylglutathione lyase n=1 Tax=Actinocrispum wychmicini TaxID=1213861 RepID=A0A4R2K051_9PSEU|nr:putative enzyme related to lactoylglutathione lyase [Actinocrispum wychmicini]